MSENKEEQLKPLAEPEDDGSGPRQPGAGGDKLAPAVRPADSGPENPSGGGN